MTVTVNQELKVLYNLNKKTGGCPSGWGRIGVNQELKLLNNFKNKTVGEGVGVVVGWG